MEEINAVGFHANYKDKCKRFIDDKEYLIISEDKDFLGRGMYFWPDYKQAEWWRDTKKDGCEKSDIVSARICTKNVLDITDDDILNMLEKLYCSINNALLKKMSINSKNVRLGIKLDALFKIFNDVLSIYDCVYGTTKNENRPEHKFLENSKMTRKPEDIILVKKWNILSERKIEVRRDL